MGNTNKLIDQWVETYPLELKPLLNSRRFNVEHPDWWDQFNYERWQEHDLWLGGEPAAKLLTQYLMPEHVILYGHPDFKKLAKYLRPARNEHGKLELLDSFWNFEFEQFNARHRLCPPLLVYADLVSTGEARQLEVANMIRDKYLARH